MNVYNFIVPTYQNLGGSPIQHQILNGIINTKLSAFKINKTLDTGICV